MRDIAPMLAELLDLELGDGPPTAGKMLWGVLDDRRVQATSVSDARSRWC